MLTEFFANWTRFTVKQTLVPNIANNDACFWHGVWEWGGRFVNLFVLLPQCQTLQTFHTFLTKWTEKAQHKFVSVQLHEDFLVSMKPFKGVRTRLPSKPVLSRLTQAVVWKQWVFSFFFCFLIQLHWPVEAGSSGPVTEVQAVPSHFFLARNVLDALYSHSEDYI